MKGGDISVNPLREIIGIDCEGFLVIESTIEEFRWGKRFRSKLGRCLTGAGRPSMVLDDDAVATVTSLSDKVTIHAISTEADDGVFAGIVNSLATVWIGRVIRLLTPAEWQEYLLLYRPYAVHSNQLRKKHDLGMIGVMEYESMWELIRIMEAGYSLSVTRRGLF